MADPVDVPLPGGPQLPAATTDPEYEQRLADARALVLADEKARREQQEAAEKAANESVIELVNSDVFRSAKEAFNTAHIAARLNTEIQHVCVMMDRLEKTFATKA